MQKLNDLMSKSEHSQSNIQNYDRANGLPKSHSPSMVKRSRSRKQLQKGIILSKHNGSPLISYEEGKGWQTNYKRRRSPSCYSTK